MNRLNRTLVLLLLSILIVSALVLTGIRQNYNSVNRIMSSEIHELYQHTIKLKMDNDRFLMELQGYHHHPVELHSRGMKEALDLMALRLVFLESTASGLPDNSELMPLYLPLKNRLELLTRLVEDSGEAELSERVPEIRESFDEYSERTWNLILTTDRIVKGTIEESVRIFRYHEFSIMIISMILILAILSLLILLHRHRKNLQKLRINEEQLRVILDSLNAVVLSIDQNFKITTRNRRAEEESGNSAVGMDLFELFPELPLSREEIASGITEGHNLQIEYRSGSAGEEKKEILVYPLSDSSSQGAVLIIADRSEQARMKELIAQNEKMLSVGGLAAGMAHEINNPLAGMIQTAAVIRSRLTDWSLKGNVRTAEACGLDMQALDSYLEKRHIISLFEGMSESGEQASAIVGNMLDFVQRDSTAVSTHDMVKLVDRSLELAATDYDMKSYLYIDKIEIIREFEDDIPLIPCSGSRIQQVILNILRNGAEAMVIPHQGPPEGSHFIIRLKKIPSAIRLEIEDNGPGMDEEVRKRIFDPFYTTKEIGEGTGLGLSVAFFIITENHKGKFIVDSAPGRGTNFIIELPLAEDDIEQ